ALELEGQLVGLPVGAPAAIVQSVQPVFLVAVEKLVACDPGDTELAAQRSHLLAFEQTGDEPEAFVHAITLLPGHSGPPPNAGGCKPCLRNEVSAMCREAQYVHSWDIGDSLFLRHG